MPYTIKKPPDWLKKLPKGAIRIGVDVFNAVLKESKDEEKARKAAWSAIKAKYEKKEDGKWSARANIDGTERAETIRFRAARQTDERGLVWEVVLIEPGLASGYPRFYWPEELLAESESVFEGVDLNAYELTADFFSHLPIPNIDMMEDVKRYLTAKKVGWVEKAWWEDNVGIKATIHILPEQASVMRIIQQGIDQGKDDVLGLSIDTRVKGFEVIVEDWTVIWVTKIVSCSSVDVVTHPAAGGKFLRAVSGLQNKEVKNMDREKFLKMIGEVRPDLLEGKDRAALSDDEILELARMAMEKQTTEDGGQRAEDGGQRTESGDNDTRAAQGVTLEQMGEAIKKATKEQEMRAACGRMLDTELLASDLPELAQKRVRKDLEGKVFEKEALTAAIKEEKDYLAGMATSGMSGLDLGDQTRVSVGIGTIQRAQMAVDRLLGITKKDVETFAKLTRLNNQPFFEDMRAAQDYQDFDQVPAFTGLREMYNFFTGDDEVSGRFYRGKLSPDLRASMDITSATFTYVLGNTLGRRLVKDYRETDFREDVLISIRKPVKDFRNQEAVMVGYWGDLPDADPETGDYEEATAITDEETAYAIGQKGELVTITRKTIINDDISLITRIVQRRGRAARRTHAKYVWNKYISNVNCSDGTAWFTSGHGNLGSGALAFAAAITAYKALAKMTEKDSGERIGLLDNPAVKPTLVFPIDLMETGEKIVNDDHYFTSNDLTTKTRNPLKGKITGAMISLLTDANDWGLLMPPSEVDMVEMGYLNGRQEPETFVADTPQSEQVFVADKVRHKIRHEYGGGLVDFRSGYKAVVA